MARVKCPFCLKPYVPDKRDPSGNCTNAECKRSVPAAYIQACNTGSDIWLVTVGFSGHGKTCYINSLVMLLDGIGSVLEGASFDTLNQDTDEALVKIRIKARKGELAGPTEKKKPPLPLLVEIKDIPGGGSRCLIINDVAGEIFNSRENITDYVNCLREVDTVWFFVSLRDFQPPDDEDRKRPDFRADAEGRELPDLLRVYQAGMEQMGARLSGRNLIVIYTKGDKIKDDLTPELEEYFYKDPFTGLAQPGVTIPVQENFSLPDCINELRKISEQLENYTRDRVPGGRAFINMVRRSGMNLYFCLTSALGHDPPIDSNLTPSHVLDPLFWTMDIHQSLRHHHLALVLDSAANVSNQPQEWVQQLWDRLAEYGELKTFVLGQSSPVSRPGQVPPLIVNRQQLRPRLLGPLVDNLPEDTRVLVLTAGPIIDLADYYDTAWKDRLILAVLEEQLILRWPNLYTFRPHQGDPPDFLVKALLDLS